MSSALYHVHGKLKKKDHCETDQPHIKVPKVLRKNGKSCNMFGWN